eukprot:Pgem_evm1s11041
MSTLINLFRRTSSNSSSSSPTRNNENNDRFDSNEVIQYSNRSTSSHSDENDSSDESTMSISSTSSNGSDNNSSSSNNSAKRRSISQYLFNFIKSSSFDTSNNNSNSKLNVAKPIINKIELLTNKPNFFALDVRGDVPTPRSGHISIVDEDNAYLHVFGGYHDGSCYNDVYSFHIASNTWFKRHCTGTKPTERVSHQAVIYSNHLMVFGGSNVPFGHANTNDFYTLDLDTYHWKNIELTGELPCPRYGHTLVQNNDKVYMFGGTSGCVYFNDLHVLDLKTKTWTMLQESVIHNGNDINNYDVTLGPSPRYRHEAVSDDEYMYVVGGGIPNPTREAVQVYSYHFATGEWKYHKCDSKVVITIADGSKTKGMPIGRRSHTCILNDNKIYMYGGTDGVVMFNDFWILDLKTFIWDRVQLNRVSGNAKCFHSASVTNEGQMLLFGGCADSNGNVRSNDISSCHTNIPTLKSLCVNTVAQHTKQFSSKQMNSFEKRLTDAAVPEELVHRIIAK